MRRAPSGGALSDAASDKALPVATDGTDAEHALASTWTFWGRGHRPAERGASRAAAWESEKLHAVKTVEAFWRLHGALQPPSSLASGATYQLFRGDVEPTWEDAANANGGEWSVALPDRCPELDDHWLKLCLAAVGGALAPPGDDADLDEVCGLSLGVRKGGALRLGVWTKNRKDAAAAKAVGAGIRSTLALPADVAVTYTAHDAKDTLYEV